VSWWFLDHQHPPVGGQVADSVPQRLRQPDVDEKPGGPNQAKQSGRVRLIWPSSKTYSAGPVAGDWERLGGHQRDDRPLIDETTKRPPSPNHIAKDHDSVASRIKINLHLLTDQARSDMSKP
jgi:hypothetical protein